MDSIRIQKLTIGLSIPHICLGHHGRCPCKEILSGVKGSRLNRTNAYFALFQDICSHFWVFFHSCGCTHLGLKNPVCVKEMTNMRYACLFYLAFITQ